MQQNKVSAVLAALIFATTAAFAATPPEGVATLYGHWSKQQNIFTSTAVWTNAVTGGGLCAWTQGSYGVVKDYWSNVQSLRSGFNFWGLCFCATPKKWTTIDNSVISVGAGGFELPDGGIFSFGDANGRVALKLTGSQTWTGSASADSHLGLGYEGYQEYFRFSSDATDCPSLTLNGRLKMFVSWTNDFSQTDIRVESPAEIRLAKKWVTSKVTYQGRPEMRAKSLTLAGDGVSLEAGGTFTSVWTSADVSRESRMDEITLTKSLILEDGADLNGTAAEWGVPSLTVRGGESALLGSWTFVRPLTKLTIEDGATLSFSGSSYGESSGISAGFEVSGKGTLSIDPRTFMCTGAISLGDDVTLALVGNGEFGCPVSGGKVIRVAANDAPLTIAASAVADYSGEVIVSSGKLILSPKPEGVTVVEEGGEYLDLSQPSSDPWAVTDAVRAEQKIVVGPDNTLVIYGNGLTTATELELAGGRIVFRRSTEVASPLTLTATTSVGAETHGVKGLMSGFLTGISETSKTLTLEGPGTVNLSGGANLDHVGITVAEGSANLVSSRFDVAYADVRVESGDYLGIRDGAYLNFAHPQKGGYYGLVAAPRTGATAVIEVCSNSTVKLNQNCNFRLGKWHRWGILRLSGGTVDIFQGSTVYVGYETEGWGEVELNDGTFITTQSFWTYGHGSLGRITWRGGCIRIAPQFWTWPGNPSRYLDGESSNLTFAVVGPHCVLDLNGTAAFTNVVANSLNAESWQWTDGGCLTVTNGGTFVMNRFPSDGCVAVKDCNLQIADDRVPAIGEIGFAGTSAADSISGTVGGLSAQRVRVGAGAEWRPSQVANIAWEDLVFDDGATILLSPDANGMVPSIAVQGKAMLGDTLVYRLERNGNRLKTGSGTLISAVGGVVGDPEFVRGDATPKGLSFSVENAEALLFKYMPPGILLLVK